MNYVTYTPFTGEIRSWGQCDIPIPLVHTDVVLEGIGTNSTHYVSNGNIVAYTGPQLAAKAAIPPYPAAWDNSAFAWIDQRSLDDAKAATWAAVKTGRDAELYDSFVWDGSRFDSDQVSQTRIQGAVQLATIALSQGQNISIDWTLYDNTTRTLSATDFVQLGVALGTFVTTLFAAGVTLRDQIVAATTVQQVDAIKWVAIF